MHKIWSKHFDRQGSVYFPDLLLLCWKQQGLGIRIALIKDSFAMA
jgi:hypothetical protein